MGARDAPRVLPDGALAQADRLLGGDDGASGRACGDAAQCVHTAAGRRQRRRRWGSFAAALEDDFDTPRALAVLHGFATERRLELLRRGLAIFGLASLAEREEAPPELVALAEQRDEARAQRDFETADRLRDELAAAGWELRDDPGGGSTLVRRA